MFESDLYSVQPTSLPDWLADDAGLPRGTQGLLTSNRRRSLRTITDRFAEFVRPSASRDEHRAA